MKKNISTIITVVLMISLLYFSTIKGETQIESVKENQGKMHKVNEEVPLKTCGNYTYYNISIMMISTLYVVTDYAEDVIILKDTDNIFFPFGLFIVFNESEIQHFTPYGGWINSKVWIYGYEGFIKMKGLWTIIIGECNEIIIKTYR